MQSNPYTYTKKHCPRCGSEFVCQHDSPTLCQCAGIALSGAARAYLKATYTDCLCAACLREIAKTMPENNNF